MADERIEISAIDRGAARLVKGIADALRTLSTVQAQQAAQSKQQAQASRTVAQSLQEQTRFTRAAVVDEQNRLRIVQQSSKERIAAIQAERKEEVAAAEAHAKAQNIAAKGLQQMAAARAKDAEATQSARLGISPAGDKFLAAQVAARKRELAEQNANVARANALGQQQIAQARLLGVVEEQAARKSVQEQRLVVNAARERARQSLAAAKAADTDARSQERAAQRAEAATRRQAQAMQTTHNIASQLRNTILNLVAAYSGFRAIEGFIGAGLRFNQVIESSRLGIGALITAEADLFDQQGKQLHGTQALAAAQGLASDQLDKLRVAGIQTAATTEDLVTAFEEAVGAGVSVGLTLDQIRKFTVSIAQAASAIHLPMNQLQQETRSILQGTIDRNSRIAKALQLTNAEVNLAKEQGRLADLLNEKFKAFNIAGVESVKTFGALKSNISDAFSVFAGRATEPLFTQLRDAGSKALASIFDFSSADISASFRGMIAGLQILFEQIGGLLADAIREAVNRAEALSAWLAKNRQEVKDTAAAIRTMVEDFGHMVSAIVSVVASVGSLGDKTNTVIGLARTLSAVFQTIADNVGLIVSLLISTKLATIIRALIALGPALSGAAAGESLAGPVGAIIGALLSLGISYKLLSGFQKEARLEAARTTTALQDQAQSATELLGTLASLQRQLHTAGISDEERASLMDQVRATQQKLMDLGPEYKRIIDDNTGSITKQREELRKLTLANIEQQRAALFTARDELRRLQDQKRQAATPQRRFSGRAVGLGAEEPQSVVDQGAVNKANEALRVQEALVATMTDAYNKLIDAAATALGEPATLRTRHKTDDALNKDRNDAVQRAQAELEVVRDANAAKLDLARIQFKRGLITETDVIKAESDAAKAQMDAELKLLEAQRDFAANRVVKGKIVPDQGGIDAANAKITGLQNQRVLQEIDTNEKIEQARQNHLDQTAKIEVDFARESGRRLRAIRLEVELKHQQELRDAIREFGPESDQVIHLKFVISQQSIDEQAKEIEQEIHRIQENIQREIATARLRILGADAQRGAGSAQQRQQLADAISKANQRGVAETNEFRNALIRLRDAAADKDERTFIQSLIDQIDQLKLKAKEVDEQMRRLKEGAEEALVGGLAGFFEALSDSSKSLAADFKAMVDSILADIGRLVARLLAEKIVYALTRSGGGPARGNQTQSGGRATGGPAGLGRPPHGLLSGGIPGVDSIHIAAQPLEYFTQTKAVQYYGLELFDALNNMQLPRVDPRTFRPLAMGGGVIAPSTATARQSVRSDDHLTIHFDRRGMLDVLEGRPGRDAVLGHIQTNPRAVTSVVRRGRRA